MPVFTQRQLLLLVALTLIWGVNWPVMKLGVQHFPPLSLRAVSMWIGVAIVFAAVRYKKLSLVIPRSFWPKLTQLTLFNMVLWNCLIIVAIPMVSSGRAAILGYTMPIFSAVVGRVFWHDRLALRGWSGVATALLGITLLLWHEFGAFDSRPVGAILMLVAALGWAVGTQMMRRTPLPAPLLSLTFWMMLITAAVLSFCAWLFERTQWAPPDSVAWGVIVFNGLLALGFAQIAWFTLARSLPPIASTLSVMFIPVLGVFCGAWWLGEVLHWQDWTAVGLMTLAIASVLWPDKAAAIQRQPQTNLDKTC